VIILKRVLHELGIIAFAVAVVILIGFAMFTLGGFLQRAMGDTVISPYKNWGLINTRGRSYIDAPCAWKITEGDRSVVVAVVDTGIDPNHGDLYPNLWRDPSVQDSLIFGWNFVSNEPNPFDDIGHGTHVAGIIGAVSNPAKGSSGVAHRVTIMPIKYYSDANPGSVNLRNTIKAINYAIDHGVNIINYSGGGPKMSEDELLVLKRAEEKGIIVVTAAGNDHNNVDALPTISPSGAVTEHAYYPTSYHLSNQITVAATDINNNLLESSNYGRKTIDVAAPGENIYSTLPGGRYGYMSGTSQATAFVSGIAALILSVRPDLKPAQVRKIIMDTVDKIPQLTQKIASGGRVNACSALTEAVRAR
jgi:subtilisin family serine protease